MKCCKIQTYECSEVVDIPEHMLEYKQNKIKKGLSGEICIDKCIVNEIKFLWKNGIKTYGCCCGHNKYPSWVNVLDEDFEKMEKLGYEKYINECNNYTYKLKFNKEE